MEISLKNKQEITKAEINYIANNLKEQLDLGEINPLLLLEKFRAVEKIYENLKETLTKSAVKEASLYPDKNIDMFGAVFTVKSAGTTYDYSLCNDSKHTELVENLEKAKKELKKREDFLKSISDSETIVDTASGEVITVFPPSVKSSTIVQCSIK